MKRITSAVTYKVPSWNFCNVDHIDITGDVPKETCKFYSRGECLLHGKTLSVTGKLINKTDACIRATAGIKSTIESDNVAPPVPTVPPGELMKYAVERYSKTYRELVDQGFPQTIADTLAKKHIYGTK